MFWESNWPVVRSAGSGSTPLPNPDLITSNGSRTLAIECKAIKSKNKHFPKEEIDALTLFSKSFGAEPWLAVRFDNNGWHFIQPNKLKKIKSGNYSINLDLAKKQGINFQNLIK